MHVIKSIANTASPLCKCCKSNISVIFVIKKLNCCFVSLTQLYISDSIMSFLYVKYLQEIDFLILKFCKGLKSMCKFFKKHGQKIFTNLPFSRNPWNIFHYRPCARKFVLVLFSFIFGIGNFVGFFLLSYNGNYF